MAKLLIAIALALLTACGGGDPEPEPEPQPLRCDPPSVLVDGQCKLAVMQ